MGYDFYLARQNICPDFVISVDDNALSTMLYEYWGNNLVPINSVINEDIPHISLKYSDGLYYILFGTDVFKIDKDLMPVLSRIISDFSYVQYPFFALHAGAIAKENLVCGIVGKSMVGKSTLVAKKLSEGWGYVCDDMLVVNTITHECSQDHMSIKLREGGALALYDSGIETFNFMRKAEKKLMTPAARQENGILYKLFFLRKSSCNDCVLLDGHEKFHRILAASSMTSRIELPMLMAAKNLMDIRAYAIEFNDFKYLYEIIDERMEISNGWDDKM